MYGSDDGAGVGYGVTDVEIRNSPKRHLPVRSFQALDEGLNGLSVMVGDHNGHDD
jgi:hypothetical protein